MRFKQIQLDVIMLLSVFLVGFVIRIINLGYAIHIDELLWIKRGPIFIQALADLNPDGTFITYHPGVTVSYISGLMQLFLPEHSDVVSFVRLPFCIFGAATGSLIYLMGKSMFNRERGLLAALLLTFEPFYIGITRLIHMDGLLSFFVTLTLYLFWLGATQENQKYIILSGISLGLSVLTKGPAIFLIPILAVWILFLIKNNTKSDLKQAIRLLVTVLIIGGVIVFILWPGLWNLTTDKLLFLARNYHAPFRGHDKTVFFLRPIPSGKAPFYYYLVVLPIRLSTGVAIFLIISLALFVNNLHKRKVKLEETLLLLAFVIFIIAFSVFGQKMDRYLIPIWPTIALISSSGLQAIINWTKDILKSVFPLKSREIVPKLLLCFVVVFPAAFWSVQYQPFYVFYFNDFVGGLKGGSQITVTYTSEGTRLVAEYLSSKSNALTVACAYSPVTLAYFYEGNVTNLPHSVITLFEQYDYVVFHLTFVQRNPDNIIWQYFKDTNPEFMVVVQDVITVWVFNLE